MAGFKLNDTDRFIKYATTADLGELSSAIRTMTLIRDARVQGKGPAKTSAKKPASDGAKAPASTKATSADGKDPERVERGRKAAETRARKKAEKEAALASANGSVEDVQEQEAIENFRVPNPQFGPEGELLLPEQE